MVKVENYETLQLVTSRFMKMNKKRNVLAILAIMLTTLLFTSLFMGTGSLLLSNQATLIKQTMSSSHIIAQDMSDKDAEKAEECLKNDEEVERYGAGIFLGVIINSKLPFQAELRSGDDNYADSFNCKPETGRMPQKENEIAVSSLILDAYGIPRKIGENITIVWEKDGMNVEHITETFTVSGIWKGDKAVLSQLAFVSPEYAEKNRHIPINEESSLKDVNGSRDMAVWYKNLYHIEEKTKKLNERIQFSLPSSEFQISPAFDFGAEDSFSVLPILIFTAAIVLAGYLIIYNIFNLSVKIDIRTYGLLKNVGTTGKQLKKIVRMQAFRLCIVGIPLGLLAGYIAGSLMAPSLASDMEISASSVRTAEIVVATNPLIFLFSILMTLFTVYLSSLKSCQIVDRVSPIDALKVGELVAPDKKSKKTKSISWYGMAVRNMRYNLKKGMLVMLSIALSLVTINVIYMLVTGYDFEEYQKVFLASDFQIDKMTSTRYTTNFNGVTEDVRRIMDACKDVERTGYVYYSDEKHEMENHLQELMNDYADTYEKYWGDYEKKLWEEVKSKNEMTVHYLGITEEVFHKLEWADEPCSWDDFKTGKYILVDYPDQYESEHRKSYYHKEDKFLMKYQNGVEEEYEVLGEALMPYSIDYPYSDIFYLTVLVPEEEYIRCTGNHGAMYGIVDAKEGKIEEVDQYIKTNISEKDESINVFSVLYMQESFEKYISKYYTIGALLVVILIFIGVMNFYNTVTTTIISRKRELTLLEIVGMTRTQVIKMLVAEGLMYIIGAFILAVLIVYFCAETLIVNTLGMAFFYHAKTTILPCILMIPVLLFIAIAIPHMQYKKIEKESLVERVRVI